MRPIHILTLPTPPLSLSLPPYSTQSFDSAIDNFSRPLNKEKFFDVSKMTVSKGEMCNICICYYETDIPDKHSYLLLFVRDRIHSFADYNSTLMGVVVVY